MRAKKIFGVPRHMLLQFAIAVALVAVVFISGQTLSPQAGIETPRAQAAPTPVAGWAWSDNIGWISLNCSNTSTCGTNNYGLSQNAGLVTGYAWSDNIGWIKFGGLSSFPTGSGTTASDATVSGSNMVGWARACAGTSAGDCSTMTSRTDGWDGWIALSGTGYSTSLLGCSSYNCAGNWAWGGEVVGWLSFNVTGTAPSVTTNAATGVTSVAASLNGTGNPNNSSATGYFRYSATNPGSCSDVFGTRAPASSGTALGSGSSGVAFFNNISGLTPGTTYYYCALASSVNGVGMGSVLNFTTTNDICTDIPGNQASVPTGCQSPVPPPSGACIPSGYTWNGSQCIPNPPVVTSFFSSPSRVRAGSAVTLFYTVTNPPASCTIRSNAGFGPVTVNPVNNVQGSTSGGTVNNVTTFTLTCGSVTSSITVNIIPIFQEI